MLITPMHDYKWTSTGGRLIADTVTKRENGIFFCLAQKFELLSFDRRRHRHLITHLITHRKAHAASRYEDGLCSIEQ